MHGQKIFKKMGDNMFACDDGNLTEYNTR